MRKIKKIFLLGLFLVGLPLSASGPPSLVPHWVHDLREIHLSNGMKFLLYHRGEVPIFSAYIRFPVGGLDEEPGKTGLAHFLEHMAFKGTQTIGSEELSRRMLENGGTDYNATTSKDMTSYFVSLPSEKLAFWAELESERIFKPVFREFYEEKDVVLEERRMRVDNDPDGQLYEAFLQAAFRQSPYRWSTLGSPEDLKRLTVDDLVSFWKRHYHPSRAVGVLVGKIDLKEAERILEATFGKIIFNGEKQEGESSLTKRQAEPPQKEERHVVLKVSARPRLMIGYHKPTLPHTDDYLFDLLDQVLGNGRSSRLYRSLVLKKKLASYVGTATSVPGSRLPNLFMIEAAPVGRHTPEELIHAIDEEIEKIQKGGVADKELQKAKNRLTTDFLWRVKTNEGLASQLSYFEIVAGGWKYLANYLTEIDRFRPEDLRELANRYLQKKNRTTTILKP